MTPSAATVSITPSADAGNYATTYTYVAGTLTITPAKHIAGPPHAVRLTGAIIVGRTAVAIILGTGFYGQPRITSSAPGTRVGVSGDTGTRLTIHVTVREGTPRGMYTFTITLANGRSCKINYRTT